MRIETINNLHFGQMVNKDITLKQRHGLHVRPSGYFAKLASLANGDVVLFNKSNGHEGCGKSIIAIMTLEATRGDNIMLSVDDKIIKEQPKLYTAMVKYLDSDNYQGSITAAKPFLKELQNADESEFDNW